MVADDLNGRRLS